MNFRIGQGIDIHRLVKCENSEIVLGGVKIQSQYKVIAHSDGDLVFHSIVDAILGALGLPNIGYYFPPSDSKYKGKESSFFIAYVKNLMEKNGYSINNLDITLISEVHSIIKYREDIINSVALALNIQNRRVNIKGTTSEKKGFIGRKEGMQCYAIILLMSNKESY